MKTVEIHTTQKIGISTVFISETLSLFFCGVFISTVFISETFSLFFVGFSSQQFAFQKPSPYFFVRDKVSEMKTVEIQNPTKK